MLSEVREYLGTSHLELPTIPSPSTWKPRTVAPGAEFTSGFFAASP